MNRQEFIRLPARGLLTSLQQPNLMNRYLLRAASAMALAVSMASVDSFGFSMDFEEALGNDGGVIAGIPGVTFTTTAGETWRYGDTTTGAYNTHSIDLGIGGGIYDHYGVGWAWLGTGGSAGRIDFDDQNGTFFQVGYSSASSFFLEAYDSANNLIDSAFGAANVNLPNTMDFLRVDAPAGQNISYVIVHDSGNFFIVDNMTGDMQGGQPPPPVPDGGSSIALMGLSLAGLAALRRARGSK